MAEDASQKTKRTSTVLLLQLYGSQATTQKVVGCITEITAYCKAIPTRLSKPTSKS